MTRTATARTFLAMRGLPLTPTRHDGAEIRRRRQRRGIKPGEFAKRIDLHVSSLRHIELGSRRPSPEVLHRIAAALDCDVAELLVHGETP